MSVGWLNEGDGEIVKSPERKTGDGRQRGWGGGRSLFELHMGVYSCHRECEENEKRVRYFGSKGRRSAIYKRVKKRSILPKNTIPRPRALLRVHSCPAVLKSVNASLTRADMVFSPSRTHTRGSKYFLFGLSSPSGLPTCDMI